MEEIMTFEADKHTSDEGFARSVANFLVSNVERNPKLFGKGENKIRKINYNNYVKVKLGDEGRRIFRMRYGHEPHIDENGFYEEPLWLLMYIFGPHIKAGQSIFKDGCIYVDESNVESN